MLLVIPIYVGVDDGPWRNSTWSLLFLWQRLATGQETACPDCFSVCCINWICRIHRNVTAELAKTRWNSTSGFLLHGRVCQTSCRTQKSMTDKLPMQAGQLQFYCFARNLSDTLDLKAKEGCPIITEEIWMTVQARRCLCEF